ncbi:putative Se/S carrier-like protein [Anaerosalibacter massiliensis]|uniref:DUF3343 domain-containing protein n=1 Tax=Anaerosalibacter massiliensis TaxID=1347392 RepID=A0A9X2MFT6_9FIRM|nr:putative Se/S carrier-like protein [Anaerosalibacter massiliensis]MCR2042859.1 DUF3343 domain-containing protein [Anaerosalibacter massiliensis]
MREKNYYICLLSSKNYVIQIIYILENLGYTKFDIISTPYEIRRGCDYAIKFKKIEDLQIIMKETNKLNMEIKDVYKIERINGEKTIKKIKYFI